MNITATASGHAKHYHHAKTEPTRTGARVARSTGSCSNEFREYLTAALVATFLHAIVHALSTHFDSPNVRVANTSVFLMVSASFYSILATSAKQGHPHLPFDTQSSVFYTEVMKLIFMSALNAASAHVGEEKGFFDEVRALRGRDVLAMAIPALLFAVQNNLNYVAFAYVDAETFQMLGTMKIIFTGVVSFFALQRPLTVHQCYALASVSIGVVSSNMCRADAGDTFAWGAAIVCVNQLLAAVALVANEYILTHWKCSVSFHTKNTLIYLFGAIVNTPMWHPATAFEFGFVAWTLTAYLAIIGVSVACVLSHLGATIRNLLGAGSLVCTSVVVHVRNRQLPDTPSVMSTLLIVLSISQYFHVPSPRAHSRAAVISGGSDDA